MDRSDVEDQLLLLLTTEKFWVKPNKRKEMSLSMEKRKESISSWNRKRVTARARSRSCVWTARVPPVSGVPGFTWNLPISRMGTWNPPPAGRGVWQANELCLGLLATQVSSERSESPPGPCVWMRVLTSPHPAAWDA